MHKIGSPKLSWCGFTWSKSGVPTFSKKEKTYSSSGSGKSAFLQFKYTEVLDNWKKGDSFPFFMNLASQGGLKNHWEWLMNEIGEKDFKLSFFSWRFSWIVWMRYLLQPIWFPTFLMNWAATLWINLFSCRTESIQKENVDFNHWFRLDEFSSFEHQGRKRYIAPLDLPELIAARRSFSLSQIYEKHSYWLNYYMRNLAVELLFKDVRKRRRLVSWKDMLMIRICFVWRTHYYWRW